MKHTARLLAATLCVLTLLSMSACRRTGGQVSSADPFFELGNSYGGTYENRYFGIGCTLEDDWKLCTEEQLAARNALDPAERDLVSHLSEGQVLYDMLATGKDGRSISVVVRDLGLVYGSFYDEEQYINSSVQSLLASLTSMGMSELRVQHGTMFFAGRNHGYISISGALGDRAVYQRLAIVENNGYIAVVTASCYGTDETKEALADFYYLRDETGEQTT